MNGRINVGKHTARHRGRISDHAQQSVILYSSLYAKCVEAADLAVDRMIRHRNPINKLADHIAERIDPATIEAMKSLMDLHDDV